MKILVLNCTRYCAQRRHRANPGLRELTQPTTQSGVMLAYLWIAAGGAVGSVARYWFSGVVARQFGETFPWGTLLVNVSGSFAIGFLATLAAPDGRWLAPAGTRQFVMIGVLGGYTTFSSFSLQTLALIENREWLNAGGNVAGSVVLCLVAVWLGHLLAASVNSMRGT
jgi:fluoride exporter